MATLCWMAWKNKASVCNTGSLSLAAYLISSLFHTTVYAVHLSDMVFSSFSIFYQANFWLSFKIRPNVISTITPSWTQPSWVVVPIALDFIAHNMTLRKIPWRREMATHSNMLAWEIPWTGNLVSYSPWGHKRVRHDLVTKQQQHLSL